MVYHIMHMNTPVIDIITNENNTSLTYTKFVPDSPKQPFWGENITIARFYNFLKSRCYEDSRRDLPEILAYHGLKSNNPYEWVKISHGVTYEDFFWIKFDNECITWEDVKIR